MVPRTSAQFQEPLEAEAEDLEIEFKLQLALDSAGGKSKLAKEVCALANHGGGWIVLGRNDDGTYPDELPDELNGVSQDTVNNVCSTYLQPAPHCSTRWVKPTAASFEVFVIRVPSLQEVPICGKKNGPNGTNEQGTVGVSKGVHYIRKSGPRSEAIETPDQWKDVIRKCVLSDKSALLASLSTMIDQTSVKPSSDSDDTLVQEMEYTLALWQERLAHNPRSIDPSSNYIAYGFHLVDAEQVDSKDILEAVSVLTHNNFATRYFFVPSYPEPHDARIITANSIDGVEVDTIHWNEHADASLWRISENMSGVEIKSFWEDTEFIEETFNTGEAKSWEQGEIIWIQEHVADIYAFLTTVQNFAQKLKYVGAVRIRAVVSGLAGRYLASPTPATYYSKRYTAYQNNKVVDLIFDSSALQPDVISSAVAKISQPINKLTQGPEITAESVMKHLSNRS